MRRVLVPLLLAVLAFTASARTAPSPLELVKQTSERMLSTLKAEQAQLREHPERLYRLVDEIVLPHFDFRAMARWVLGKHWRRASAAQRERFVKEFRVLLVRTYATALMEYTDQRINYLPLREDPSSGDVTIRTEIEQPGGLPIPINYSMHLRDGAWKVYDVTIDGISLVANYRTTFSGEIRQGGLDRLIAKLAARNRQASQ